MGGIVSTITDDWLGFDPNGGGIYSVARDVLGNTIADDILGLDPNGGGIVPLVNTAANIGVSAALGDIAGGLLSGAGTAAATDASFLAADAAQLAAQGLGEAQIADVLGAAGASSGASSLAASMAVNGLDAATMTQQLGNLSSNTGLFNQNISNAAFNAADAAQLAQQTGNNIAAIEQNLIAAGIDPLEAATLAQDAAKGIAVSGSPSIFDSIPKTIKDNPQLLKTLTNLMGMGLVSQVAPKLLPTTQTSNISAYKPAESMPTYSPEYYQQVQQYYNTYLPAKPANVTAPLQQWYDTGYSPDSVTAKLFSGG